MLGLAVGNAIADECKKPATVSGKVETINLSETLQLGEIELTLTSGKHGKTVFDETGGVIGRITESNPLTGESYLNHSIIFQGGTRIETEGDYAKIQYPLSACSFAVVETISNYRGSGVFYGATGEIVATGTVSVPPCPNKNEFTLSGTVCMKD